MKLLCSDKFSNQLFLDGKEVKYLIKAYNKLVTLGFLDIENFVQVFNKKEDKPFTLNKELIDFLDSNSIIKINSKEISKKDFILYAKPIFFDSIKEHKLFIAKTYLK